MKLALQVRRANEAAGLVGEQYEFDPFLNTWATWGEHRLATRTTGLDVDLPALALPSDPSQVRGDEAVWLDQKAHTLPSGVDAIDEANKEAHAIREIAAGSVRVPLDMLLEAALEGQTIPCPVVHTQLHSEFSTKLLALQQADLLPKNDQDLLDRGATLCSYKGTLQVTPLLRQEPQAAKALLQALKVAQKKGTHLQYNSPEMQQQHAKGLGLAVDSYVTDFVTSEETKAKYPLGKEATLEHLHFPYHVSAFGPMPLGAMLQLRLKDRPWSTAAERAFYVPTKASALFANEQVRSACARLGMDPSEFVAEVKAQMTQSASDPTHRPGFLKAVDVVGETGTFVANRVQYTADQGYPNRAALDLVHHLDAAADALAEGKMDVAKEHAAEVAAALAHPNVGQITSRIHRHLKGLKTPYNTLARAAQVGSTPWRCRSMRLRGTEVEKAKGPALAHECELTDAQPALGLCYSEDCDAVAGTSADTVRNLPTLAAAVSAAEAPYLHAAAAIVNKYYVFTGIASVSGGYVDTNGKDLSDVERRKITDLPIIGDELDKRTKPGGHAIGVLIAKAVVADALARAGDTRGAALATGGIQSAAWERRSPIYILEGTASSDGYVLPMGEIGEAVLPSGGDTLKVQEEAATRKAFLKGLLAQEATPALVKNSNLEGLGFYATKQDPQRRVSNFYLGMALLSSPDLAALDPRLGALALVDVKAQTRGAEMGRFLRMPFEGQQSEVGLVPAYSRVTRAQWDRVLNPVVACILNQMPLAQSDVVLPQKEKEVGQKVGQIIPPSVVLAAAGRAIGSAMPLGVMLGELEELDPPALGYYYVYSLPSDRRRLHVLIGPDGSPVQTVHSTIDSSALIPDGAYVTGDPFLIFVRKEDKFVMRTRYFIGALSEFYARATPARFRERFSRFLPPRPAAPVSVNDSPPPIAAGAVPIGGNYDPATPINPASYRVVDFGARTGAFVLVGPFGALHATNHVATRKVEIPREAYGAAFPHPWVVYVRSEESFYLVTAKTGAVRVALGWDATEKNPDSRRILLKAYGDYLPRHIRDKLRSALPSVKALASNVATSDATTTTPLCFYLDAPTISKEDKMRAIFAELDAAKGKGEIEGYTLTRDQPLLGAAAVYTLTVQLPVVSQ